MLIQHFYDLATATWTYVVTDEATLACAVIDPVLDYDPTTQTTHTASADQIVAYIQQHGLRLAFILETHVHADHLTAASYLKSQLGGQIAIGSGIKVVLAHFVPALQLTQVPLDGSQFDMLLEDGDVLHIGKLPVQVLHTPGHTPACVSYKIEDAVFVGDTLFVPRMGTARADFPGGDAQVLYASIQKILSLPPATRIFVGHDYPPQGEEPQWQSTVQQERLSNTMVGDAIAPADFIHKRQERDKMLAAPRLLVPALQMNMRGWQKPLGHVQ